MLKVDYKTIEKQSNEWFSAYDKNNVRGNQSVEFTIGGDQWDNTVASKRLVNNKESLVFNLVLRYLKRMKAQSREIDFSLNLSQLNKKYQFNNEEINTLQLLLSNILLSKDMTNKLALALDKCCEFGYSVAMINYARENQETLNMIPTFDILRDPTLAFFDKKATDPCKINGRFCGIKRILSREELINKNPSLRKNADSLQKDGNEIYDYWYRDYREANFILLKSGIYKREDLLTEDDKENIARKKDLDSRQIKALKISSDEEIPLEKTANISTIYFQRMYKDIYIVKPKVFPTDDLPLIYHAGCTYWVNDSDQTYPLTYHQEGSQRLHNYIGSQIATIAKNTGGDKWFMNPTHAKSEKIRKNLENINQKEGVLIVEDDPSLIRRESPGELPVSMINMFALIKQEIDEIGGAMIDTQPGQSGPISSVAIEKITHNLGLVNVDILAAHIYFVHTIGKLYQQMIPKIYTEERTIVVTKADGTTEAVMINENLGTGKIKNNIKDINNHFFYEITASPSSTMQKENTINALTDAYKINPQLFTQTADIYFRNLDFPDAAEIAKRVATLIDPNLIKYSQGDISLEEYQQLEAQAQQQQLQQQMQIMTQNPEFQVEMQEAQAKLMTAQAHQQNANNRYIETLGKIQNNQNQIQIELAKILSNEKSENNIHHLEQIKLIMEANQKMIDSIKNRDKNDRTEPH